MPEIAQSFQGHSLASCYGQFKLHVANDNKKPVTKGREIPYQTDNQLHITPANKLQDQPNPTHEKNNKKMYDILKLGLFMYDDKINVYIKR